MNLFQKNNFTHQRQQMVDKQLRTRGIQDPFVLKSFLKVPRETFVPPSLIEFAYQDTPLPIAQGQSISQPYIVALMTQLAHLNPDSRVLEIGTGSGYAAAILSQIVSEVYTIERVELLAQAAQICFQRLNYSNISVKIGDGTLGWPEKAPFDAILVTAGSPATPSLLLKQLKVEGRLIIPVGERLLQELCCYYKTGEETYQITHVEKVRFVPLIGEQGWST